MTLRLTITCDNPLAKRAKAGEHSSLRCLSDTNENPFIIVRGFTPSAAEAFIDLCRLSNAQGWRSLQGDFLCPGCVRFTRMAD